MTQPTNPLNPFKFEFQMVKRQWYQDTNLMRFIVFAAFIGLVALAWFGYHAWQKHTWRKMVGPAQGVLEAKLKFDLNVGDRCPAIGARPSLAVWDLDEDQVFQPFGGQRKGLNYIAFLKRETDMVGNYNNGAKAYQQTAHLYLMDAQDLNLVSHGEVKGPPPPKDGPPAINTEGKPVPPEAIGRWVLTCRAQMEISPEEVELHQQAIERDQERQQEAESQRAERQRLAIEREEDKKWDAANRRAERKMQDAELRKIQGEKNKQKALENRRQQLEKQYQECLKKCAANTKCLGNCLSVYNKKIYEL